MTNEQFKAWLASEVTENRMSQAQMDDLLQQKQIFDENRTPLQEQYKGRVVGYANRRLFLAQNVHLLLDDVKRLAPGSLVYFEPIGFDLI